MSAAIAHALRHLHSLGIVHRTINPESVLFEPETQTIRLDVPLWKLDTYESSIRVVDVFDAPEVLSRQQFSAVSDIYSVGILVYSTLIGSFPWTDQNGTPRIRAAEDSVPRLPSSLSSIQQEIDEMLAFDPSARNYSYEGFFDLSVDEQTDSIIARGAQYRSGMIDIAEVQQVALPLDQSVANTSVSPSARSRFWIYGTLLTIALVGVLASLYAYTNFDSVRMLLYEIGLADHPDLSERWRQAESLRLDQNQSLITLIAAYNKVLELKPSHIGAQQAIADGKKERRETIETLIKTDEFAVAQARLDEYVTAVPNDVEIAALVTQLENRQRRDRLLADARPLVAAGMEDLALLHAAVLAYKSVLSVFPDSEEARRRLHDIAVRYAEEAINAVAEAEIDNAWDFYEKAKDADPDAQELEQARESVQLAASLETKISTTLERATELFEQGRLITPSGEDNAMSTYRQVVALDPDNIEAQNKIDEIEQRLIEMQQDLLEEREFGAEANLVRDARRAGVSETTLQTMVDALENLKTNRSDAAQLYSKAMLLFELGYISAPANDNAIEVLREAQELDRKNTDVEALLDQCAERIAAVAVEAYTAGFTGPSNTVYGT